MDQPKPSSSSSPHSHYHGLAPLPPPIVTVPLDGDIIGATVTNGVHHHTLKAYERTIAWSYVLLATPTFLMRNWSVTLLKSPISTIVRATHLYPSTYC
ncbi:hypothetical protein DEO72_LG11g2124 [Vigna unguiculata]|uniref:Uncharacterized protein n=1 Tax=Vigna unguiculata TaxID=3917 RepID=A0A4D6NNB3_VIGUN|nr:hypothetical protein DEO72_LG11g2124 [Vigna unguiculata]